MNIISVNNPYRDYIYTCPHCGTKFEIEHSDLHSITFKPLKLIERDWRRLRLDPNLGIPFIDCGCCRKPVPLKKVVWDSTYGTHGAIKSAGLRRTI